LGGRGLRASCGAGLGGGFGGGFRDGFRGCAPLRAPFWQGPGAAALQGCLGTVKNWYKGVPPADRAQKGASQKPQSEGPGPGPTLRVARANWWLQSSRFCGVVGGCGRLWFWAVLGGAGLRSNRSTTRNRPLSCARGRGRRARNGKRAHRRAGRAGPVPPPRARAFAATKVARACATASNRLQPGTASARISSSTSIANNTFGGGVWEVFLGRGVLRSLGGFRGSKFRGRSAGFGFELLGLGGGGSFLERVFFPCGAGPGLRRAWEGGGVALDFAWLGRVWGRAPPASTAGRVQWGVMTYTLDAAARGGRGEEGARRLVWPLRLFGRRAVARARARGPRGGE
jgi:hypothetical protein